jgi:hypothetical protein
MPFATIRVHVTTFRITTAGVRTVAETAEPGPLRV